MNNYISKKDKLLIKQSLHYLEKYKFMFFVNLVTSLGLIGVTLLIPLNLGNIIQSLSEQNYEQITRLLMQLLIIYMGLIAFNGLKTITNTYLNSNIIADLKNDMFRNILDIHMSEYDKKDCGEFASRLDGDIETLSNIITNYLLDSIINVLKSVFLGVCLLKINLIMSIPTIISSICSYCNFSFFGNKLKKETTKQKKIYDEYYSIVYQSLSGIRYIKSNGLKERIFIKYKKLNDKFKNKSIGISVLTMVSGCLSQIINNASQIITLVIGIYFVYNKQLTMSLFIAFTSYSGQLRDSLVGITRINSILQQSLVSLNRIFEIVNRDGFKFDKYGNYNNKINLGNIEFRNVTFTYNSDKNIFEQFNLKLNGHKITVIIGENGSGKSTLINLILRLYEPTQGVITIDNTNINDMTEVSLRKSVSVVNQQTFLFNLSIRENFEISCPGIKLDSIKRACELTYIDKYISSLENGYDSIITENGSNLSGGQKQRLVLAICIAKNTPIILFDEPTSAIDLKSQILICNSIKEISKNKNIIIVSHSKSMINIADNIVFLEHGKVIAEGTHNKLYSQNKEYKKLYDSDFKVDRMLKI